MHAPVHAVGEKQRVIALDFYITVLTTNAALAFIRERTVRGMSVDADGDEIVSGHGRDDLMSGEDAELLPSKDTTLEQFELRKGETLTA